MARHEILSHSQVVRCACQHKNSSSCVHTHTHTRTHTETTYSTSYTRIAVVLCCWKSHSRSRVCSSTLRVWQQFLRMAHTHANTFQHTNITQICFCCVCGMDGWDGWRRTGRLIGCFRRIVCLVFLGSVARTKENNRHNNTQHARSDIRTKHTIVV